MKLFIYKETQSGTISLKIEYEEEALIVAESIESAKEFLFQACFFGKGNYDSYVMGGSGGDGHFPNRLDYTVNGGRGIGEWEKDCREEFFGTGELGWMSIAQDLWEGSIRCLFESDIEVADGTKPGIYLKAEETEKKSVEASDNGFEVTKTAKTQFKYWDCK
jgi:hypothetical protein